MERKYRALRFIATLFKILAWIVLVGGIISAIGALIVNLMGGGGAMWRQFGMQPAVSGAMVGITSFFAILVTTLIEALSLFAAADYIALFLDIEANTRATAHYLQEINRQYQSPPEG